jgi:hypothetical protein
LALALTPRRVRRVAVPLFDDVGALSSPGAPHADELVEAAVLAIWRVVQAAASRPFPAAGAGGEEADDRDARELRDKLALVRLQMESLRRRLAKKQAELAKRKEQGAARRRRSSVAATASDRFVAEQATWHYWADHTHTTRSSSRRNNRARASSEEESSSSSSSGGEAGSPGARGWRGRAYRPPVALEEVDDDALEAEVRAFVAGQAAQEAEAEQRLARRAAAAATDQRAELLATAASAGGALESELESTLKGRQARKAAGAAAALGHSSSGSSSGSSSSGSGSSRPGHARTAASTPRAPALREAEVQLASWAAAAQAARRASRNPAAVLGIMAQDVRCARRWLQGALPHLAEQRPAASNDGEDAALEAANEASRGAGAGAASAAASTAAAAWQLPDFAGLAAGRAAWATALAHRDVDALVNFYSLKGHVLGHWFDGKRAAASAAGPLEAEPRAAAGGGGHAAPLDRAAVRALYEALLEAWDVELAFHAPPCCCLRLVGGGAVWRSDVSVRLRRRQARSRPGALRGPGGSGSGLAAALTGAGPGGGLSRCRDALVRLEGGLVCVVVPPPGGAGSGGAAAAAEGFKIKAHYFDLRKVQPNPPPPPPSPHDGLPLPSGQPPPGPPLPPFAGAHRGTAQQQVELSAGLLSGHSRWAALLDELSREGAGVAAALTLDLEANWAAVVSHTDAVADAVDVLDPHAASHDARGFDAPNSSDDDGDGGCDGGDDGDAPPPESAHVDGDDMTDL